MGSVRAAARSGLASPLNSPLRFVATAGALVALAAHVPITEDHLEQAPYIGVLFIVLEIACLLGAVLLLRRDTVRVWLATGLVCAAAVGAYVLSRSSGLPQITDDIGNWTDLLGIVAVSAEVLVALAAAAVVLQSRSHSWDDTLPRARWHPRPAVGAGGLVAAGCAESAANAGNAGASAASGASMSSMDTARNPYWGSVGRAAFHPTGRTRTCYIGADEVVWNYAPQGRNDITGQPFDTANTYVKSGPGRIGAQYLKCQYHSYTDATFTHLAPRPADQQYLGLLGPMIHAEVGDTIKVEFRNSCRIPASVHPHGVFYAKASEGAPHADNTTGANRAGGSVLTGGRQTYTWLVPDRAGPGPHDGTS